MHSNPTLLNLYNAPIRSLACFFVIALLLADRAHLTFAHKPLLVIGETAPYAPVFCCAVAASSATMSTANATLLARSADNGGPTSRSSPENSDLFLNRGRALLSSWSLPSSAHDCVGAYPIEAFHGADHTAAQKFMAPDTRLCVFRNLCTELNGTDLRFVYFRDKHHPIPFEHSNTMGSLFDPPSPLLRTRYGGEWMHLAVRDGPIPPDFARIDIGEDVHILTEPLETPNIGHILGDGVWPIFNVLLDTRMLSTRNQLVFTRPSPTKTSPYTSLSQRPLKTLGDYPPKTCFSWAVAGDGGRKLDTPSLPTALSWSLLHDFVYERYQRGAAATIAAPPFVADQPSSAVEEQQPLQILVRFKNRRHTFTNYNELIINLRKCYPSAKVLLLVPESVSSFYGEFEILSQTSVYITPGGGGSFPALFLPNNAVVIFGAACWPHHALACSQATAGGVCCIQIERYIWSNFQFLHVDYYTFTGRHEEMSTNASSWFPALDWDYPVDIASMRAQIDRGLFLSRGRSYNVC